MDLPVVVVALDALNDTDMSDELSDPPSDLDGHCVSLSLGEGMDIDEEDSLGANITPSENRHGRPRARSVRDISGLLIEDGVAHSFEHFAITSPARLSPLPKTHFSHFELLPNELLEKIAVELEDCDLHALSSCSVPFAKRLIPENSGIWEARFLSRYDYPLVDGPLDFCAAYRLRRLVLRKFRGFGGGGGKHRRVQLEVLRDMVLGEMRINRMQDCWHRTSLTFPLADLSSGITLLMTSPPTETYNHSKEANSTRPYQSKNLSAFATALASPWMVTFLSSPFFAHESSAYGESNALFDALQIVLSHLVLSPRSPVCIGITPLRENYNIELIYLWNKPLETIFRPLFPADTTSVTALSRTSNAESKFSLDLHCLLHIRNFWHRHLSEEEPTSYANMASALGRLKCMPKEWTKPLHESLKMGQKWFGHYTCIHPWPKTRVDLEERQTCAEDWGGIVNPLTLSISTTQSNTTRNTCGWWPSIFQEIPAISNSIPEIIDDPLGESPYTYLRGLAPFLDLSSSSSDHPEKYNPFLALRVRGITHAMPDQEEIPGWNHIVMVLYKPTTRYLIEVLETSLELYGNPFQQQTGNALAPTQTPPDPLAGSTVALVDDVALERALRKQLQRELDQLKGPLRLTTELVLSMEDQYGEPGELDWGEVEYAYAYEGVVVPGGKMMMGRWWQVGRDGLGDGWEVVRQGGAHERGAFVFWC